MLDICSATVNAGRQSFVVTSEAGLRSVVVERRLHALIGHLVLTTPGKRLHGRQLAGRNDDSRQRKCTSGRSGRRHQEWIPGGRRQLHEERAPQEDVLRTGAGATPGGTGEAAVLGRRTEPPRAHNLRGPRLRRQGRRDQEDHGANQPSRRQGRRSGPSRRNGNRPSGTSSGTCRIYLPAAR